ncbi:GGDEF domain-containing protein [Yoonia sp. 2307UL14-13]|uniref:GGDEF domain-containing protein n=1 Tax=Yoonia sp. 2307UL14-13 TaxID=3126506 RepID=UPI0030A54181
MLWLLMQQKAESRRLARVAACDPVTAIAHRQAFSGNVENVLSQSGAFILLDIDDFRRVNDRYGRDVGDLCLRALAQRLRELTRTTDVIGRLDGPSFAVHLPGAMMQHAGDIAQRLSDGLLIMIDGRPLRLTISAGVVFADGHTSLDQLIFTAERALDRAKLQGRARVEMDVTPFAA